jgi:glycosyltransferase involved in cell wall biosynthesis
LAALATRAAPLVITLHGSDVRLAERPGIGALAHAVASRAVFVAAVSDPLLQEARAALRLDPERSGVVRMPIAVDSAHLTEPPRDGPPWRLVAVGRASPEKGFDVLLDAVHIARRDGADVTLDIVGDGPDRAALEARSTQLGLAGAVRFLGPLSRVALYERMATAHAVVVPSRREGLGLVAVEALALGRPVIASQVGGLPEVVTAGTGILVPPGDPAALARALQSLPLPSPPADAPAVAAHSVGTVIAAHRAMYARAIATS